MLATAVNSTAAQPAARGRFAGFARTCRDVASSVLAIMPRAEGAYAKDLRQLYILASQAESISPSLANELRSLASRDLPE